MPLLPGQPVLGDLSPEIVWATYTPTLGQGGTVTATVNSARYAVLGKLLFVSVTLTATASGTGSNNITVSLPVSVVSSGKYCVGQFAFLDLSLGTWQFGMAFLGSATQLLCVRNDKTGPLGSAGDAVTLASGDILSGLVVAELP